MVSIFGCIGTPERHPRCAKQPERFYVLRKADFNRVQVHVATIHVSGWWQLIRDINSVVCCPNRLSKFANIRLLSAKRGRFLVERQNR
jgi:hypothetical protein